MTLKAEDIDGADYVQALSLRGGSLSYDVDLSEMDCGCVAGMYLVQASDNCIDTKMNGDSGCQSIDVMQANKHGFNVQAHPCADGDCDAVSQCSYNVSVEGKKKYGKSAYGPGASIIDTNKPFSVTQAFVADEEYTEVWKLRTTWT